MKTGVELLIFELLSPRSMGVSWREKNAEAFAKWCLWALAHADRIDPPTDEDIFDQGVDDYEVYSLRE